METEVESVAGRKSHNVWVCKKYGVVPNMHRVRNRGKKVYISIYLSI